ncbi:hypothetical protein FisN_7Lh351 [Fistulifera solaris]|uniref:Chalcone isomerase domain-containing protein n=1 Tax=Fistulifera solaris TaxID=1519565 RepID=A0A1Z5JRG6_FISSO|nr:hypothetical protein FisN_7Lh351 [Fistulifera solaris]|eukprot:GAX16615.1 hypothetical protein FisN_7Lh351 [Fistulifera solaris]
MRVAVATAALAALAVGATAFQPHKSSSRSVFVPSTSILASSTVDNTNDAPCAMPDNVGVPPGVTAKTLRSAVLTNADGESVRLGDKMGPGTSIQKEGSNDIAGPIFVSIGDKEKLELFLKKNPYVSREQILVDNFNDFAAYKAAGFGRFDEQSKETIKAAKDNMASPDLGGWKGAMTYLSSVGKLSPIPADIKFGQIPEGVLRLGGTFVVSGNDIVYQWSDRLPGDHPDIEKVWSIAKEASHKKGLFSQVSKVFGL